MVPEISELSGPGFAGGCCLAVFESSVFFPSSYPRASGCFPGLAFCEVSFPMLSGCFPVLSSCLLIGSRFHFGGVATFSCCKRCVWLFLHVLLSRLHLVCFRGLYSFFQWLCYFFVAFLLPVLSLFSSLLTVAFRVISGRLSGCLVVSFLFALRMLSRCFSGSASYFRRGVFARHLAWLFIPSPWLFSSALFGG